MGDPLHVVFLAGLDYGVSGHQTAAIRGIRSIWNAFDQKHTFGDARSLLDQFQENPTTKIAVYASEDKAKLEQAVLDAVDAHQGAALFEVDPDDLSLPHPEKDPEGEDLIGTDGPFSPAAYETALALLGAEEGVPTSAFFRASQLARVTGDASLYEEVLAVIVHVFPTRPIGPGMHILGYPKDGQ